MRYPPRTVNPQPPPRRTLSPFPPPPPAGLPAADPPTRRLQAIGHLVGNTPLLEIALRFRGRTRRIFAKAEQLNMTGSIKDRMALHILRRAYADGGLAPGERIVEATSGNTGISFAAIGRALGHPVTIFMPDWMSRERVELIRSLGAEIRPVRVKRGASSAASGWPRSSPRDGGASCRGSSPTRDNVEAHAADHRRPRSGGSSAPRPHARRLRRRRRHRRHDHGRRPLPEAAAPRRQVHPLEPANSPTLSTGHKVGKHRIQGISDEFIPAIVTSTARPGRRASTTATPS